MICPKCEENTLIKHGFTSNDRQRYRCKSCSYSTINPQAEECDLNKRSQKNRDLSRIERKEFRDKTQVENAILAFNKSILKYLESKKNTKYVKSHRSIKHPKMTPIIQVSDTHFNELVDLEHNQYDFKIASQRMQKYAHKCLKYLKHFDTDKVIIAFTGDLLNSDRRLDELLSMATNRTNAAFLSVDVLTGFILDLNQHYNVEVVCVSGNESRVGEYIGYLDLIATDNYDFTIFKILDRTLGGKEGIKFIKGADPVEQVVNCSGQNVLIQHGTDLPANGVEKAIQSIKGKYASRGIVIHYVIYGHLHCTRIGDTFARSASLVGANAYSDRKLNLAGRAAQNLHLLFNDGSRDCIKIDLQDANFYKGYPLDKDIDCYNSKSVKKRRR